MIATFARPAQWAVQGRLEVPVRPVRRVQLVLKAIQGRWARRDPQARKATLARVRATPWTRARPGRLDHKDQWGPRDRKDHLAFQGRWALKGPRAWRDRPGQRDQRGHKEILDRLAHKAFQAFATVWATTPSAM